MEVQVRGEWTTATSGGCPKYPTWNINPQFQLVPSIAAGASATYTLTLRQRAASEYQPIGLWVLLAEDVTSRKKVMSKLDMSGKSKFKASEQQVLKVNLIAREGGLPYIVCTSFFDPGLTSSFTLTLHAPEDPGARLIPLQPVSGGPAAEPQPPAAAAPPPSLRAAPVPRAAPARAAALVAAPVAPLVPPAAVAPAVVAASAPVTPVEFDGEPTLTVEGQGLSEKQQADAARMIAAALATIPAGGMFEDSEFSATATSLGPGAHASCVASWRRPREIAGAEARLWKNDWEIEGIMCGLVANGSLMGAANVLAGDRDVIAKVFVSTEHGERGLYALRFWQDDPSSDDDWKVVLIDDRLPCGPDGELAFTRSPDRAVFWAALLEKALAKLHGSYAATEAPQTQEAALLGLELLSGGKAREQPLPLRGAPAEDVWAALQEASRTAHVMGARLDPAAAGAAAVGAPTGASAARVTDTWAAPSLTPSMPVGTLREEARSVSSVLPPAAAPTRSSTPVVGNRSTSPPGASTPAAPPCDRASTASLTASGGPFRAASAIPVSSSATSRPAALSYRPATLVVSGPCAAPPAVSGLCAAPPAVSGPCTGPPPPPVPVATTPPPMDR
mmetsp:Transcript_12260/g.40270  ORF Transcript_12260/g.40270 Transcript_12260/m.40270 type:complete len:617 (-) Transcript_12260:76-1926(-)